MCARLCSLPCAPYAAGGVRKINSHTLARVSACACSRVRAHTYTPPHTHLMSAEDLHTNTEEHTHDHAHTGVHEHTHTQRHTQDVSHLCSQSVIPPRLPLCLPLSSSCSPFEVCYVFLEGWYYCAQPPPYPLLAFSFLTPPFSPHHPKPRPLHQAQNLSSSPHLPTPLPQTRV